MFMFGFTRLIIPLKVLQFLVIPGVHMHWDHNVPTGPRVFGISDIRTLYTRIPLAQLIIVLNIEDSI